MYCVAGDDHGFDCDKMGNTSYTKTTGTSFAAPQVAGAAAMWLGGTVVLQHTHTCLLVFTDSGHSHVHMAVGAPYASHMFEPQMVVRSAEYPEATPAEVRAAILTAATKSKLSDSVWPLSGTPGDQFFYVCRFLAHELASVHI